MAKGTLEFNLPEEQEDFVHAQNAHKYSVQLDEVWNSVFRPRHKHGYNDNVLNDFCNTPQGNDIMDRLETLYRKALDDNENL